MNFSNPQIVESICWQMRLADWPRSQQRAKINNLFNGAPPYSAQEVRENNISINVNELSSTRLGLEARGQQYNALLKAGNYFSATTDFGSPTKRREFSSIVTDEINRIMKNSLRYFEKHRSTAASKVLHGISPSTWKDRDCWCPDARGVEDVLVPSNTLLTMENLPFFAVFEQYTAWQLYKLTHGPKCDPGWNLPMVDQVIAWADSEGQQLMGASWPETWSPEKMEERIKEDGGLYASDTIPTIDCWKLYFWDDSDETAGWRLRIILDAYGQPGVGGISPFGGKRFGDKVDDGKFLYNSGDRVYGATREELISFQFADLSAVAPFKYHSVRSLGFMLYAPCHLQNRLKCKFNEAVFEALMMYFRVHNMEDAERALKIDLINRGFIDDSVEFVKPQDRWQPNAQLVELGIRENQQTIDLNSASYVANQDFSKNQVEKTKFQVQTESINSTNLISAALMQTYEYQKFEYREIFRRFCKENSRDPDVRKFRVNCLRRGVPYDLLEAELWNIEPERVMGSGNKTLELQIAQQLMSVRPQYDPESQRQILRDFTLATTDDPARTKQLVPDENRTNNPAIVQAQLATGTLMQSLPVAVPRGIDMVPYIETMLASLASVAQKTLQSGGVPTPDALSGMKNVGAHINQAIQQIAQDPNEKQRVKVYGDDMGKIGNEIKAFEQRLAEQQQASQQQAGAAGDPAAAVKAQAAQQMAQLKLQSSQQSNTQKLEQKKQKFALDQQIRQDEHNVEMQREQELAQVQVAAKDLTTAAEIKREHAKAKAEAAKPQPKKKK